MSHEDPCNWKQALHPETDGIIAGCTVEQEWLLTWWWMHLRMYSNHPVTFINFGNMSKEALHWCHERGEVINLEVPELHVVGKKLVDPKLIAIWESIHHEVWQMRPAWFKKPFALLQSPYRKGLWLDIDCQVRGCLRPLFEACQGDSQIAMVEEALIPRELDLERGLIEPGETEYNSGALVFKHGAPIIRQWAQEALTENHLFMGDQQLLGHILFRDSVPVNKMPDTYNWRLDMGMNHDAIVWHWLGGYKKYTKVQMDMLRKYVLIDLSFQNPGDKEDSNTSS